MDLNRYARQAVESLLDNETLTADLDDEAANLLLCWGCDCVYRIVQESVLVGDDLSAEAQTIEQAIAPRMRALRRMLREINLWAAQRDMSDPEALARIVARASVVYGRDISAALTPEWSATDEQPVQRIIRLRQLLESAADFENKEEE